MVVHRFDRIDAAADVWIGLDRYKEAVDIYVRARMFDAARRVAQQHAPHLIDSVEYARTQTLVESKDAQALIAAGQAGAGLDVLVQQDRWQEVLQLATEQGPQMAQKYAVMYAARMFNLGKVCLSPETATPEPAPQLARRRANWRTDLRGC